jgi:probable rRNA maturation factor
VQIIVSVHNKINSKVSSMSEITIEINIEEEEWQKTCPNAERIIKEAATAALHGAGIAGKAQSIEVSVLLTNDEYIQSLNHNYRDKDKPTNVLSFPLEEFVAGNYADVGGDIAIGDIIFALETISREAQEQTKSMEEHLAHLAVHGTLHLIGYDHENDHDAEIMEALEVTILAGLGIANPYADSDLSQ